MVIITLLTGGFLIALGFLVKKYPILIAGYNTLSEEKKKNVDIAGLSTLLRNGLILMGVVIIGGYTVFHFFNLNGIANQMILISIVVLTPYLLIRARKYYHNKRTMPKLVLIITVAFLFFGSIAGSIYYSVQPPEISQTGDLVTISGTYGVTNNVSNIELQEIIPFITRKTNGFNFGDVLKGEFRLEELGLCTLFLQSREGPFVVMTTNESSRIIINFKTREETENLFIRLTSERSK